MEAAMQAYQDERDRANDHGARHAALLRELEDQEATLAALLAEAGVDAVDLDAHGPSAEAEALFEKHAGPVADAFPRTASGSRGPTAMSLTGFVVRG
jgi:hypothetical protein